MQLGELQQQYERFKARGAEVVAISVDPTVHSTKMVRRLGLTYIVASDQDQAVQKAFGVQNPDTQELALHAVFLIDEQQRAFYRKIAGRRPLSQELLDAIDYHQGNYPMTDKAGERTAIAVAFPQNNFQALIEVAANSALPTTVDQAALDKVVAMIQRRNLDDATIAYRAYVSNIAADTSEADLLATAAWLARKATRLPQDAVLAGAALNQALLDLRRLRASGAEPEKLAAAEAHLEKTRSLVGNNANTWRLRSLKTTLRGYREVSLAVKRESTADSETRN